MVSAMKVMWNPKAPKEQQKKMLERFKDYQFLFGVATAHELCHAFVHYLSKYYLPGDFTPPRVTHLDYGLDPEVSVNEGVKEKIGESGRWFENELFGGSLEFYRDPTDDDGQVSNSRDPSEFGLMNLLMYF